MKNLTFIVFNMNTGVEDKERKEAAFKDFDSAIEFCNTMVENGVYQVKPAILDFASFLNSDEDWWFSDGDWNGFVDNEYLNKKYPFENVTHDDYLYEI